MAKNKYACKQVCNCKYVIWSNRFQLHASLLSVGQVSHHLILESYPSHIIYRASTLFLLYKAANRLKLIFFGTFMWIEKKHTVPNHCAEIELITFTRCIWIFSNQMKKIRTHTIVSCSLVSNKSLNRSLKFTINLTANAIAYFIWNFCPNVKRYDGIRVHSISHIMRPRRIIHTNTWMEFQPLRWRSSWKWTEWRKNKSDNSTTQ